MRIVICALVLLIAGCGSATPTRSEAYTFDFQGSVLRELSGPGSDDIELRVLLHEMLDHLGIDFGQHATYSAFGNDELFELQPDRATLTWQVVPQAAHLPSADVSPLTIEGDSAELHIRRQIAALTEPATAGGTPQQDVVTIELVGTLSASAARDAVQALSLLPQSASAAQTVEVDWKLQGTWGGVAHDVHFKQDLTAHSTYTKL